MRSSRLVHGMNEAGLCLLGLATLVFAGCTSEYNLMTAPGVTVVSTGANCSFEVSKGLPAASDYIEIGRLEAQFFPASNLDKLRETTTDQVCRVGGDLLVGEWDGDHFMAAVIYRRRAVPLADPNPKKPVQ